MPTAGPGRIVQALPVQWASSTPAAAACPPTDTLAWDDPRTGTAIRLDRNERELVFTTADGRELFGRNARIVGQTRITPPDNKYTPAQDVELGRDAAAQARRQLPIMKDDAVTSYVENLGRRLVAPENVHHKNGVGTDNWLGNLELWLKMQPSGQRVTDLMEYIAKYHADAMLAMLAARKAG